VSAIAETVRVTYLLAVSLAYRHTAAQLPRSLARSLKVIEIGAIRKLGCGILFAFHSNYGDILCRLRDIATY